MLGKHCPLTDIDLISGRLRSYRSLPFSSPHTEYP